MKYMIIAGLLLFCFTANAKESTQYLKNGVKSSMGDSNKSGIAGDCCHTKCMKACGDDLNCYTDCYVRCIGGMGEGSPDCPDGSQSEEK